MDRFNPKYVATEKIQVVFEDLLCTFQ